MAAATYDITIDQGSDFSRSFTYKIDGVAVNLTGYSARAVMRKKYSDTSPTATFVCGVTVPETQGKFTMALPNSVTAALTPGKYVYDLELFTLGDAEVIQMIRGMVVVRPEATQ